MNKYLVVFTMNGCPYCVEFKEQLKENEFDFIEMDIDENPDEYQMFSTITENDFVPAFMILDKESNKAEYFAPERDYNEISEAINIVKEKI